MEIHRIDIKIAILVSESHISAHLNCLIFYRICIYVKQFSSKAQKVKKSKKIEIKLKVLHILKIKKNIILTT